MTLDEIVEALRAHPAGTGILSDFDGTLAEIVDDPAKAAAVDGAAAALGALTARYARVGVVSGRPGSFLLERLGGRGLVLSGLYGLESVDARGVQPVDEVRPWEDIVAAGVAAARGALDPRLLVEDKGRTFTIHYRQAPDLADAARNWVESAAMATGLVVRPARLSYELCPPVSRDKGTVVRELAAGLDTVCFAGDDRGDLAAFDALDELAAGGVAAYRVGVASAEAPAELLERADVVVGGPAGVVDLLRRLA